MNNMLEILRTQWETLDPRSFTVALRKRYPEVYQWALQQLLPIEVKTFSDRAFVLLNPDQPKCKNIGCGQLVTAVGKHGWGDYCSKKCRGIFNSLKSRDKARQTSQANWQVENPAQNPVIREKMRSSMKLNHGVEYALQLPEIRERRRQTMIERFGVEYAAQSPMIQEKMVGVYLQNLGVKNPARQHISVETYQKLDNKDWLIEENKTKTLNKIAAELGISTFTLSKAFKKFKITPITHNIVISQQELEIVTYLRSLKPDMKIVCNDRSILNPHEIDIYLPEYNLAFEYNGLYWHSEDQGKDQHYHINKTIRCAEKGIRLIHLWENDYIQHKDIILSKIAHLFGNSHRIYARQCVIKEISPEESAKFLKETHIQGSCASTVKLGLFYNGNLSAVMTFGMARYTKGIEWELLRYSSLLNSNVVGGFSRLLKYFIKTRNPESIVSYSDKSWSVGEVYKRNGFVFKNSSKPSYGYTSDFINVEHRMSFQKKKLASKLAIFNEKLSEVENMRINGYYRIWNCGHDVWIYRCNE